MSASSTEAFETVTDDNGVYELENLSAGTWRVSAAKPGFVTWSYGGQLAGTQMVRPITVPERQAVTGIDISLPPGGAIEGQILDEFAEPIAGVTVQALQRRLRGGRPQVTVVGGVPQVTAVNGFADVTDDLGRFRLHGLPPGDYVVAAMVRPVGAPDYAPPRLLGTATTFYPGTPSVAGAQPLALSAGQELTGISFRLGPIRPAMIAGTVRSVDGSVPPGLRVWLQSMNDSEVRASGIPVGPDGIFAIPLLPPGEYVVRAQAERAGAVETATALVSLDGDAASLSLVTAVVPNVQGRVTVDDAAREPLSGVRISIVPVDEGIVLSMVPFRQPGEVRDDGTFSAPGVDGRGLVRLSSDAGWTLKRVLRGGLDITDVPTEFTGSAADRLEVVLTRRATTVSGTVTGLPSHELQRFTVVIFADDPERWVSPSRFVTAATPDATGRFSIRGLPPARYVAIATDGVGPQDLGDPEVLARLRRRGTVVTLAEGESRALDLRVAASQ